MATIYKPAGIPTRTLEMNELRLDEMEAIRLADMEGFYHDMAAEKMGISRATFGRLLESAHRKVADALFNGKGLIIKGGRVNIPDKKWFECMECGHSFQMTLDSDIQVICPECMGLSVRQIDIYNTGSSAELAPHGGFRRRRCRRRGNRGPF
ncbi:MAG: DUF134 domain-containing protein [Sedimentisphaerales bacterium]|nr:DUF134 domain-containing protein [Sedimentisphaerales bacterium]